MSVQEREREREAALTLQGGAVPKNESMLSISTRGVTYSLTHSLTLDRIVVFNVVSQHR